jgi:hypothetical protein
MHGMQCSGCNVQFPQDGYTDLRGNFEYATLNVTSDRDAQLDGNARFAILVTSHDHGSVIEEVAAPPLP